MTTFAVMLAFAAVWSTLSFTAGLWLGRASALRTRPRPSTNGHQSNVRVVP